MGRKFRNRLLERRKVIRSFELVDQCQAPKFGLANGMCKFVSSIGGIDRDQNCADPRCRKLKRYPFWHIG